jgi:hypothetical protein
MLFSPLLFRNISHRRQRAYESAIVVFFDYSKFLDQQNGQIERAGVTELP